jgi:hypothetical protein
VNGLSRADDAHAAKNVGKINATNGATRIEDYLSCLQQRVTARPHDHQFTEDGEQNIAAKRALNKLQIGREEFTA